MQVYVKQSGTWVLATHLYVQTPGGSPVWEQATDVYVRRFGTWNVSP